MIDIFCFRGRVGRIRFFLLSLASGLVLGLLTVVLLIFFTPHFQRGEVPSLTAFIVPLAIIVPLSAWVLLALQAARFRDIGWKPIYVVPAWLLFTLIDAYVAYKIPEWSMGRQYRTVVGFAVNTAISIILMFMPGNSGDDTPTYVPQYRPPNTRAPSPGTMRSAGTISRSTHGAKVGFGRRGL